MRQVFASKIRVIAPLFLGAVHLHSESAHHPEALLRDHCFECHDSDFSEGEVDIETALTIRPLVQRKDLWLNILERIRNGEMPPEDRDPLPESSRRTLTEWLVAEIEEFDYSAVDNPGYEPARRLTHIEFENALSDLFGMRVSVVDAFPSDLSGSSGFDNSANSLFFQPELFDRYVIAVEKALEEATPNTLTTAAQARARNTVFGAIGPLERVSDSDRAIRRFARLAFRRPVEPDELERFVTLRDSARSGGASLFDATRKTLAAILLSPQFLLKTEAEPSTDQPQRIRPLDLASRLSFFLWASIPDEELLDAAVNGSLMEPQILEKQIERMLNDERALSLGRVFAAQWLGFDDLGARVRLDPIANPWCTDSLMAAMREESALFFVTLLRENQTIHRLIDANFTFMNEELARLYGLTLDGEEMRRAHISDPRRGGIFGQASLLAVTSFPNRTSPVGRGKWILETVLGTPPPPPPPDAGSLEEIEKDGRDLTLKEKLALHRRLPRCAGCHAEMDPMGLSLENYDWFGRWRTEVDGEPIDARGRLPNGEEFEGVEGLRSAILGSKFQEFAHQLTRKLLTYALGRQLEYYDEKAVRDIVSRAASENYRFQSLVKQVVSSYPFQYKLRQGPQE